MDVSAMLTKDPALAENGQPARTASRAAHTYPTRNSNMDSTLAAAKAYLGHSAQRGRPLGRTEAPLQREPDFASYTPKTINFQLLLSNAGQYRARLPLRIRLGFQDGSDKIVETVKSFYGLYEGEGVSFEDGNGRTVVAQYDSLPNNATIFVRVVPERQEATDLGMRIPLAVSPRKPRLDEPFQMLPLQPYTRPSSRAARKRTCSPPSGRSRRDGSARVHARLKTQMSSELDVDVANGLSDSDAGSVSVSSSRRAKSDQLASADISVDNIVEGGRRKRAKFESSELPLFVPPQIPMSASISSVSPQRKLVQPAFASPLPGQYNFGNTHLPSPQSYGYGDGGSANGSNSHFHQPGQIYGHRLRHRESGTYPRPRLSGGSNSAILPTPDPTIGSVISDEDVALQLMRLGDVSNYSHGRTSTSTLDDAQSGKADAASSDEESDVDSDAGDRRRMMPPVSKVGRNPPFLKQKMRQSSAALQDTDDAETSEEDSEGIQDDSFHGLGADAAGDVHIHRQKQTAGKSRPGNEFGRKGSLNGLSSGMEKSRAKSSGGLASNSTFSGPGSSRKVSTGSTNASQYQAGADEDDLSSKPRCQRCRKSKKGCDRQRPCQRCKDAGIGVEGCVSEDEGNGRKGRYGRHMGVPVAKGVGEINVSPERTLMAPPPANYHESLMAADKNKKRKR